MIKLDHAAFDKDVFPCGVLIQCVLNYGRVLHWGISLFLVDNT